MPSIASTIAGSSAATTRPSFKAIPTAVHISAMVPMFLSLVRPDRISSPMTSTAAVTISGEADRRGLALWRDPLARPCGRLKPVRAGDGIGGFVLLQPQPFFAGRAADDGKDRVGHGWRDGRRAR